MIGPKPYCLDCMWIDLESKVKDKRTCKAFPEGIPEEIYDMEKEHLKVIPGQKGSFTFWEIGKRITIENLEKLKKMEE